MTPVRSIVWVEAVAADRLLFLCWKQGWEGGSCGTDRTAGPPNAVHISSSSICSLTPQQYSQGVSPRKVAPCVHSTLAFVELPGFSISQNSPAPPTLCARLELLNLNPASSPPYVRCFNLARTLWISRWTTAMACVCAVAICGKYGAPRALFWKTLIYLGSSVSTSTLECLLGQAHPKAHAGSLVIRPPAPLIPHATVPANRPP